MATKSRKIIYAGFREGVTAPGYIGGEKSLALDRHKDVECMWLEQGLLMVLVKGREVGIPMAMINSVMFEKDFACENRLSA
jgi:hypothetical protein